jgi:hypothetical protein
MRVRLTRRTRASAELVAVEQAAVELPAAAPRVAERPTALPKVATGLEPVVPRERAALAARVELGCAVKSAIRAAAARIAARSAAIR